MSLRKDTRDDPLLVADLTDAVRPDPGSLPRSPVTRFAPAPTGALHLGHLVNAIYVWGIAAATGGRIVLRIEDHDRQRSRPAYERAILDDLETFGLAPDAPTIGTFRHDRTTYRQSDAGGVYADALRSLRAAGIVYACDCARSTFAAWEATHGRSWSGAGCPGDCRARGVDDDASVGLRVAIGEGEERWDDLLLGPCAGAPAASGDLLVRDRVGNWTYALCVVVDDLRHGIDLIIRGRDLLDATAAQIRLAALLGRASPPLFLHHALLRSATGRKLSKADEDTSLRALLAAGATPEGLLGHAAWLAGLQADDRPVAVDDLARLLTLED